MLAKYPMFHNLLWYEIHALLRHLGEVQEQPNGDLKVTRNGQILVLPSAHAKVAATPADLVELRRFLEQSESAPSARTAGRASSEPAPTRER